MSIRDVLDDLPPEQFANLMEAFDARKTYVYEYEPGKFVGVNVVPCDLLVVDMKVNSWYLGHYNRS